MHALSILNRGPQRFKAQGRILEWVHLGCPRRNFTNVGSHYPLPGYGSRRALLHTKAQFGIRQNLLACRTIIRYCYCQEGDLFTSYWSLPAREIYICRLIFTNVLHVALLESAWNFFTGSQYSYIFSI